MQRQKITILRKVSDLHTMKNHLKQLVYLKASKIYIKKQRTKLMDAIDLKEINTYSGEPVSQFVCLFVCARVCFMSVCLCVFVS